MTELIFVIDPMCSWCWGFHPIIETLREKYAKKYTYSLVVGGLRGSGQMAWDAQSKSYLKTHWDAVQSLTGQPFSPFILNKTVFDYNTHPSCKAVLSVRELWGEEQAFDYLGKIQEAFYKEGKDITQIEVLSTYIPSQKREAFLNFYHAGRTQMLLEHDFSKARSMGANSFPSVVKIDTDGHMLCLSGYRPLADLLKL
ncbi:MAG: hypothetical protein GQ531_09515 [Sulfurovum sp.]|nr:hypothetical protein [Sulfurovum sp.]